MTAAAVAGAGTGGEQEGAEGDWKGVEADIEKLTFDDDDDDEAATAPKAAKAAAPTVRRLV